MALTTRLPSTRVEPFYGFVETTGDALRLIQAAREGIVPRITRRLNDLERRAMIRSGAIFIFSDEESGIKRWTEGLSWSASRIVGNFLVYREVNDRSSARPSHEPRRAAKRRGSTNGISPEELAEQRLAKSLVGCLSDNTGRFKPNGLIKKTITVCVDGSDHHLIAYYSQDDVRLGKLPHLSTRADIMSIVVPPELLESTKFRVPPIIEEDPEGRPRYICDAEEGDFPRSSSIPFPSNTPVSSSSLRAQKLQYVPKETPASTTTASTTTIGAPFEIASPPSTCSSASSNSIDSGFGWPTVSYPSFGYDMNPSVRTGFGSSGIPSPPSHKTSQRPAALFLAPQIASCQPTTQALPIPTNLIPAWPDMSLDLDEVFSFTPTPKEVANGSSTAPVSMTEDEAGGLLSGWPTIDNGSFHSSLPTSPIQPRQTRRFSSLPSSRYSSGIPSPISPIRLGGRQRQSGEIRRNSMQEMHSSALTPDLLQFSTSW